jgi:hypothetical protein
MAEEIENVTGEEIGADVSDTVTADAGPDDAIPEGGKDADGFDLQGFLAELSGKELEAKADEADTATEEPAEEKPETDVEAKAEEKPAEEPKTETTRDREARLRSTLDKTNHRLEKALQAPAKVRADIVAKLKSDPAGLFRELGSSLVEVLETIERSDPDSPKAAPTLEDTVKAMEARLESERVARETADLARQASEARQNIVNYVTTNKDKFPHTNRAEAQNDVTELLIDYHKEHKAPLPGGYQKAAALVEAKYAQLAKKLLGSSESPRTETATSTAPKAKTANKQITNKDVHSPAPKKTSLDELAGDERAHRRAVFEELGWDFSN